MNILIYGHYGINVVGILDFLAYICQETVYSAWYWKPLRTGLISRYVHQVLGGLCVYNIILKLFSTKLWQIFLRRVVKKFFKL